VVPSLVSPVVSGWCQVSRPRAGGPAAAVSGGSPPGSSACSRW
jgi:uncharacterized protein YodC (DUF2158 family)